MKIAGVDIGGTFIKAGRFSEGKLEEWTTLGTGAQDGPEKVIEKVERIIKDWGVERVGIGVPGLVDREGVVRIPPNLPGWDEVGLRRILEERAGIEVWVLNDANAFALGEWKFGWEGRFRNMVLLTLGTGIGGGIIVDGRLLLGKTGGAAEVGHITLNPDGPLCNCGNRGCLEAYIGSSYFTLRVKALMKKMGFDREIEELTPQMVYEFAERGELFAREAWKEYGYYLGLGILNLIHIFDPEAVILGGGISNAFPFFRDSLMDVLEKRLMKYPGRNIVVDVAKLKEEGGVYGAYYMALKRGNV